MAGILGEDGPDPNPPPPNQGVLDYIAGQQAAFQPNYPGENWISTVGDFTRAAAQPGMSGYFDYDPTSGSRILPHQFPIQDVAQQAGLSGPGQLGQGFFPGGEYGNVGYNIPNDRGGFFSPSIGGLPTYGQGLSTNNWRLLGNGPGWIMRFGNLINTRDPNTPFGLPTDMNSAYGDTAEHWAGRKRFVSPGNALTGANVWQTRYWPGAGMSGRYASPWVLT